MANTPLLGLTLPVSGTLAGTWGDTVNNEITSLLDTAVAGTTTLASDANVTLTSTASVANQARSAILLLTGPRTALRTITAPAQSKTYLVVNTTTGGFAVKVVGAGPTTGVTIANGEKATIVWNGSDFVRASTIDGPVSGTTGTFTGAISGTTISGTTGTFTGNVSGVNGTFTGPVSGTTGTFSSTLSATDYTGTVGIATSSGGKFTYAYTAPVAVTFSATAMVFNCSLSNVFTVTMTANVTTAPTYTNPKDGQTINIFITQDATGSRTMTWGSSLKWPGGTAGVLSTAANAVDLVVLTYRASTTFWYATLSKGFA